MSERTRVQLVAAVAGVVLVIVGILGFVPGITIHYGELRLAGRDSDAKLLGLFQVSVLHNVLRLLSGIAALVLAKTAGGARAYLVGGGAVCLLLWMAGLVGAADWIPSNSADDWLYFVLGVVMIGAGLATGRTAARPLGI
jgi:hypothetical protein